MKITICGGGSLGHVCIGAFSLCEGVEVSLLTQRPEKWHSTVVITDIHAKEFEGHLVQISDDPSLVIPNADIVLFCLPGFLIEKTLWQIAPYLSPKTKVGTVVSSTGFFFKSHQILSKETPLFGLQRAPFIARVAEYGKSAKLLGYKPSLTVCIERTEAKESFVKLLEILFATPVHLRDNYLEVSLTNSNPILHTARLYSLWHHWDGQPSDRCLLFYKEWTTEAAELLIKMDEEFKEILTHLPMDPDSVPSLLDYYESKDAESLAAKLRSIKAFENITAPMTQIPKGGWVPDFESRYFTEDFPHGLKYIVDLAREYKVKTPNIDEVFDWGMNIIKK